MDRNPGGLLAPSIPSLLQDGRSLLSNLEDCSPMSLLFILPDTVCRVWWHTLPVFPPKILVGKRPNCRGAGRSMGWWVGGDLVWRHASQLISLFSTLPFCRSVTAMHLPFKIALPKLSFFSHLTALPVFSFLLPLFLCRPDQRWQ